MKREIEAYFFLLQYNIVKSNHPPIPSYSRVSRRHQLLSPNSLILFNSPSPATAQKPVNFISHICGLGASVGCERVERTFNAPRLKAQIWLMKFAGFVCSSLNELNSNSISNSFPVCVSCLFSLFPFYFLSSGQHSLSFLPASHS